MVKELAAAQNFNGFELALEHEAVPAVHEPSAGTTTAVHELGQWRGLDTGVWEMSAGMMHDTEADEIFIVLSGTATIEFLEPTHDAITVSTGSVVRLNAGMKTRWTVTGEPLRKVYLTPAD